MGFVKVCERRNIPEGEVKKVVVGEVEVLIVNVKGEYFAVGNRCTHRGADLSQGKLEGYIITCPRHGSKFDIRTGEAVSGPKSLFIKMNVKSLPRYVLKLEGESIMVKVD